MGKKQLTTENVENLREILENFNPIQMEEDPKKIQDIYKRYHDSEPLYLWLIDFVQADIPGLSNEVRSMLGHLAELDKEPEGGELQNLSKANGHLRRFGIDSLKNLCNIFDLLCYKWLMKHAEYDYRNIDKDYMSEYSILFFKAHSAYIECQKKENLGSNKEQKMIVEYHKAAKYYAELLMFFCDPRRIKLEMHACKMQWRSRGHWGVTILLALFSIWSMFLN